MKASVLSGILWLALLCGVSAQAPADAILGQYWTPEKTGKIEVFRRGDRYYGKIVWREDARLDTENPDPKLRNRSVVGLVFMRDFVYQDGAWTDGEVYSIDNGGTYSGKLWLEGGGKSLHMRGFLGFSWIGRTAVLTRVE